MNFLWRMKAGPTPDPCGFLPQREPGEAAPRWKSATATLLGVYPTSLALNSLLTPFLETLPAALAALITSTGMVLCLTWGVMPAVTRLLHRWLQPPRRHPPP